MNFTPETLKATILKGLKGAQSSEAERIREGIEWLYEKELVKLTNIINKHIDPNAAPIVMPKDEDDDEG